MTKPALGEICMFLKSLTIKYDYTEEVYHVKSFIVLTVYRTFTL